MVIYVIVNKREKRFSKEGEKIIMKKLLLAAMVGGMLLLTACGATKEEGKVPDNSEVQVTATESADISENTSIAENETADVSTEEEPPADCSEIVNEELGFTLSLSAAFVDSLGTDGVEQHTYHEFNDQALDSSEYYVTIGDKKINLFTIYKLDKIYTPEELDEINPMMLYLGDSAKCSYSCMYCPEYPEGLTEDEQMILDNFTSEMTGIKLCFSVN